MSNKVFSPWRKMRKRKWVPYDITAHLWVLRDITTTCFSVLHASRLHAFGCPLTLEPYASGCHITSQRHTSLGSHMTTQLHTFGCSVTSQLHAFGCPVTSQSHAFGCVRTAPVQITALIVPHQSRESVRSCDGDQAYPGVCGAGGK